MQRLLRTVAAVAGAAAAVLGLAGVSASPAGAATTWPGTPDPDGYYAHCNLDVYQVEGSTSGEALAACQYAMQAGGVVQSSARVLTLNVSVNWTAVEGGTCAGSAGSRSYNAAINTATPWHREANQGGQLRAHWLDPVDARCDGPGELAVTVTSCTVTISEGVASSAKPCSIDTVTTAGASPAMPTTAYPGGTGGGALPSPCFEYSPDEPDAGEVVAFDASCTRNASVALGAVYEWTFTDAAQADASGPEGSASWAADGAYLVELSVTVDGSEYLFTRTIVVGGQDEDCPAGWGMLSPTAFVRTMKCLFVPTGAGFDAFRASFEDSFVDRAIEPLIVLRDSYFSMRNAATGDLACLASQTSGQCAGQTGVDDCEGPTFNLPVGLVHNGNPEHEFAFQPLEGCDANTPQGAVRAVVHTASGIGFVVAAGLGLHRLAKRAFS